MRPTLTCTKNANGKNKTRITQWAFWLIFLITFFSYFTEIKQFISVYETGFFRFFHHLNGTSTVAQPPLKGEVTTSRSRAGSNRCCLLSQPPKKKPLTPHSVHQKHRHGELRAAAHGNLSNRLIRTKIILTPTASCSSEKLSLLRIPQKCPPSSVGLFIPRHFTSLWYFPAFRFTNLTVGTVDWA